MSEVQGDGAPNRRATVLLLTIATTTIAIAAGALGATGDLAPKGCIDDHKSIIAPDDCANSTKRLNGANSVVVSPDGDSVYATSAGNGGGFSGGTIRGTLLRFNRCEPGDFCDPVGKLYSGGCVDDNDYVCTKSTNGLGGASGVAVSPDGKSVYTATFCCDNAIAHFERNPGPGNIGALTPKGCFDDNDDAQEPCTQQTDGLTGPSSVAVSPDGKSVYVASHNDDAVVHFERDTTNGSLKPKACVDDNDTGADSCAQSTDGLWAANSVVVSPDGKSVYVTSSLDEAIVRFDRNTTTGALTPMGCIDETGNGPGEGFESCAESTDILSGPTSVAVSPDGKSVYVTSYQRYQNDFPEFSVGHFTRSSTGALTPEGCVEDNDPATIGCAQSTDGLGGPVSVAVSPEGKSVYVASTDDDAVVVFRRDTANGTLTPKGCVDDNDIGSGWDDCAKSTDGLWGANSVVVSPDARTVYVAAGDDSAIVYLNRAVLSITQHKLIATKVLIGVISETGARGVAESRDARCEQGRRLELFMELPGPDKSFGTARTNRKGQWRIEADLEHGEYFVYVYRKKLGERSGRDRGGRDARACLDARSERVTL